MEGGAHFNSLNTAVSKNKMAVSESAEGRKEKWYMLSKGFFLLEDCYSKLCGSKLSFNI